MNEVDEGLARLHNGRAKGPSGFASENLRYAQLDLLLATMAVLNEVFSTGVVPPKYDGGLINPVFKKSDSLDPGNHEPIAVTEAILRFFVRTLNARIRRYTKDAGLRAEIHVGFKLGLSTLHPILGLQHFLRQVQRLGIHGDVLAAIQLLYIYRQASINMIGRIGMLALSKTGVKYGCPLVPHWPSPMGSLQMGFLGSSCIVAPMKALACKTIGQFLP